MLFLTTLLADDDPIGKIKPSIAILMTPAVGDNGELIGIMTLLNTLLRLVFIVAGIYALLNIIIAGINFMGAGGDAKVVASAWNRIWQTALGLLIIVVSFLLAAVIGAIFFGDPTAILQPKL
jgi:hypothetical protein